MESQKELIQKVRVCMHRNILKLALAILVVRILPFLIKILIEFFLASPVIESIMLGSVNYSAFVTTLLSVSTVWVIGDILDYVFFVFVLILYQEQRAVFWHLFAGFRDFNRVFFVSLFLALISGIGMIIFAFVIYLGIPLILSPSQKVITYLESVALFLIAAVLHIRYGFVWFLLYEQPDLKVRDALKQSVAVTKGKCLNFLLFCIKSAGLYLLIYVLSFIAINFVPKNTLAGMVNFMNMANLAPLVLFLCSYVVLFRISIAFAAWYTLQNNSKVVIDDASDTVIELSDLCTDDSPENTED